MKVYPRIAHKWVDINGQIVLAPGLINVSIFYTNFELHTLKCKRIHHNFFSFSILFILI